MENLAGPPPDGVAYLCKQYGAALFHPKSRHSSRSGEGKCKFDGFQISATGDRGSNTQIAEAFGGGTEQSEKDRNQENEDALRH